MKRSNWLVLLTLIAVLASGCATAEQGAMSGALLGGGVGAIIGGVTGSPALGTAIGGAVGAVGGSIIGAENQRRFIEANQPKLALLPDSWKNTQGGLVMNQERLCYFTQEGDYIVWREDEQRWRTDD